MLTVVTGWNPSGWREYGRRFVDTFCRYWPEDVRLIAYVEEPVRAERVECRLLSEIDGCLEFISRHESNAAARGRAPSDSWKESERAAGYSFKWDAVKFCRQGFIPFSAACTLESGLMCWLDADVVTFRPVPRDFVPSLLPKDKDLAFLGRGDKHSEIGFQLYRLPQALPMLRDFREAYATDYVFELPEWHSAHVFDFARRLSGIRAHNLTPRGSGHVWFQSPLGKYMDHLKGTERKKRGRSCERRA